MATTPGDITEGLESFISGVGDQSKATLDAVRKFVDTVNDAIPEVAAEGLRAQIIEAAFSMTRQVVDTSNSLAVGLVDSTSRTLEGITHSGDSGTK